MSMIIDVPEARKGGCCFLARCYAESLGGLTGPGATKSYLDRYYYLNCATVQAIPAHGSVTYQIKLPLPSGLPAGFYTKLDWQIQGGAGPAVATSLTVEPRT